MEAFRGAAFEMPANRPGREDPAVCRALLYLPARPQQCKDLRKHRQNAPRCFRLPLRDLNETGPILVKQHTLPSKGKDLSRPHPSPEHHCCAILPRLFACIQVPIYFGIRQDPEAHAKALVRVNNDFVGDTRTLEAILADDPNGLQFTVPDEAEFLAGREIVQIEDEIGTRLKAPLWVQ